MFTFPRTARLLRAAQYTEVFRSPDINLSSGPLRIRARKTRMPGARLGLVVTKKGTPKANKRNRTKRIIREAFRLAAPSLPPVDIVVQVFEQMDENKLRDALDKHFERIKRDLA
jgi:ribonuclease P protein component